MIVIDHCAPDLEAVRAFMNATEGNWRDSVYVECGTCVFPDRENCGGFLCAAGRDGLPVMLPLPVCERVFRRYIDPSECLIWTTRPRFAALWRAWLGGEDAGSVCPPAKRSVLYMYDCRKTDPDKTNAETPDCVKKTCGNAKKQT